MKKKLVRKHTKHYPTSKRKSTVWHFLWINIGVFAFAIALLTASALVFGQRTNVLGAQIAMVTSNGGSASKKTVGIGQQCGVNSDCTGGGSTTYCSRTGKCTKYCATTKSYYCTSGHKSCTVTAGVNKICGSSTTVCKLENNSCGYKAPTPTPKKCTSDSSCASNQICCTGNNIGTVACRGYANNTCQYGQCIGTLGDLDKCNANHTDHFHTFTDHTCKFIDKCVSGYCGAKCDATHHCTNGKTCSSSCQCQ